MSPLQLHTPHRVLILFFKLTIQGDVLIHRQGFSPGMTGDQLKLGIDHAMGCLQELMIEDGFEFIFRRFLIPAAGTVRFSKALNRSITGSMNDLVYHAKVYLVKMGLLPLEASIRLNEVPFGALHYRNARVVFGSLNVESSVVDGDE